MCCTGLWARCGPELLPVVTTEFTCMAVMSVVAMLAYVVLVKHSSMTTEPGSIESLPVSVIVPGVDVASW